MLCPVCNSSHIKNVFSAINQPLARYGLCETYEESLACSNYEIKIQECIECGVEYNSKFDYALIDYSSNTVQESRVFSPRIHSFMQASAAKLKESINLNSELILEIGCGEGYFLSNFLTNSRVVGFEPSTEGDIAKTKGVEVIKEYFNPDINYEFTPKLIILRQVLEHLKEPMVFFESFAKLLNKNKDSGYLYIEVPNSNTTNRYNRFNDFYYEHFLYFTTGSLVKLAERAGFIVKSCFEDFDNEIITMLCEIESGEKIKKSNFEEKKSQIKDLILRKVRSGNKVVAWGTAGSGTSLLNICGIDTSIITHVIDSDVRKQSKYIPGTGQYVVSPDYFIDNPPDCILILSQFHKLDISDQINEIYKNKEIEIIIPDEI